MKILFHTITYLPELEAVTRRISGLATNLAQMGHEVDICCGFPEKVNNKKRRFWMFQFAKKEVINGVRVYRYFTVPFNRKGSIRRLINNFSFAVSGLLHIFRFRKYDAVITSSPPLFISNSGRWIAKLKRSKLVFDIRDIWPDIAVEMKYMKEGSSSYKIFSKLSNKMYKKAHLITTVSKMKVESLKSKFSFMDSKVKLISNGVDDFFINKEDSLDFLEEYQFNKYFSVIHVGNIGKAQDLDSFLNLAKAKLDNEQMKFFLLGEGVELSRILKRIEEENLTNVVYCGKRNMDEVYTAFKHSKLSYVSLINEELKDSVPTKLYESIYCGCPVILSASGESVEVVNESKYGKTSNPNDFETLLNNLDYIYNNYNEFLNNKEYAFNYIDCNYNRKEITKKLILELEQIVERKK